VNLTSTAMLKVFRRGGFSAWRIVIVN